MDSLLSQSVELDAAAAAAIGAAMREVASADGVHEEELKLIASFESELPQGAGANLNALRDPASRRALLQSLVLVAFADGQVSEAERAVIGRYATAVGLGGHELAAIYAEVGGALLSRLAGARSYHSELVEVGRRMGLQEQAIAQALSD